MTVDAPNRQGLFRQSALDSMASPEQLDQMITIVRPPAWIALAAAGGLAIAALVWSVFGQVTTRVTGDGILISNGERVADAMAPAQGTLSEVSVQLGDTVQAGQIIARISQTVTSRQLANAHEVLAERKRDHEARLVSEAQENAATMANLDAQVRATRSLIAADEQRLGFLRKREEGMEALAGKGVVAMVRFDEARVELQKVERSLASARADLAKLDAQRLQSAFERQRREEQSAQRLNDAEREVRRLETDLERSTHVVSPTAGRVIEIKAQRGAVVSVGMSVITVESEGDTLTVLAFFPPELGKTVRVGMEGRVAPLPVKTAEFGSLVAKVERVSDFPVSSQGMANLLQNDQLVRRFSAKGAPYLVRLSLEADPATASGYRWSSGGGPPLRVGSGMLAGIDVVVRKQAPITLAIPLLRRMTNFVD